MYKQPDSGSSGTINIRSPPLAKSSQRAILASARLAKTTMASSSSSRSKPKSCKRRTSSILTASMRTSFPSCRDLASILIYGESVRFGCVPAPATTQPAEESPPPLLKRADRPASASGDQRIGKRPWPPGPLHQRPSCSSACRHVALRGPNLRGLHRALSHLQRRAAWPGRLAEALRRPPFQELRSVAVARRDPECHPRGRPPDSSAGKVA